MSGAPRSADDHFFPTARVDDALDESGPAGRRAGGRIRPILQRGEGGGAGRPAAQKRPRGVLSPAFCSRQTDRWSDRYPHVSWRSRDLWEL